MKVLHHVDRVDRVELDVLLLWVIVAARVEEVVAVQREHAGDPYQVSFEKGPPQHRPGVGGLGDPSVDGTSVEQHAAAALLHPAGQQGLAAACAFVAD
jgi:hypothetical protein